ncbi:hypothetical protein SDC9_172595 [bioreactor metagenome]|uniref:Uncharacterized protein n=1 Tax=bioreactor metagenome TaxID=1076179 RepID=A0A645GE68_9ZZZZ
MDNHSTGDFLAGCCSGKLSEKLVREVQLAVADVGNVESVMGGADDAAGKVGEDLPDHRG